MPTQDEQLDEVLNWHIACREEIKLQIPAYADPKYAEEKYAEIVKRHKAQAKSALQRMLVEARIDQTALLRRRDWEINNAQNDLMFTDALEELEQQLQPKQEESRR